MFKTILLLFATLVLSSAFVTYNNRAEDEEGCQFATELWGTQYDEWFYYCIPNTNTAVKQKCPADMFFVKNETAMGCVQIHPYCLFKTEFWGTDYSDSFYYCLPDTNIPVKQACPPGDFFVRNETVAGCVNIHPYCQYKTEIWGSADGTKFYYCIPNTNTPIEQKCPPDTFFVKNSDVAGCLPLDEVDSNCVYLDQDEPPICTDILAAHPSRDPTKFYLCIAENMAPLKFSCAKGKAFLYQGDYQGCFDWTVWREVRNCPE